MTKPPAQTIFTWLRLNKIPLGGLTSQDAAALQAATHIAALWLQGDDKNREASAKAFQLVVEQMQRKVQITAFHAIAHVGDWSHRQELWFQAGLGLPQGPECYFGPHAPQEAQLRPESR